MAMQNVLVTGAAGFIGYHLCRRLLERGLAVVGLDNLNSYYDVQLKKDRLAQLRDHQGFRFLQLDLVDESGLRHLFQQFNPEYVINLAAQAGVRYSLQNPRAYVDSNLVGFVNLLECCRQGKVRHLVYASSSSVYGANQKLPFSVRDRVDHPVSLYAATKKANELLAHTYSHIYKLPTTGLRFFTVYGPWGRPDMALFLFTRAILENKPIEVFNEGQMQRDFTYIDDIVTGVERVLQSIPAPEPGTADDASVADESPAPYRIYNIGNNQPVALLRFIEILESALHRKAVKKFLPMQPGDVVATYADIADLMRDVDFRPETSLEVGIPKFVHWYRSYYQV
jgi:UDP-glucuronate 4-epimerase